MERVLPRAHLKDIREFIALFISENVEFLLVGGYAIAYHRVPRFTEGIGLELCVVGRAMLIANKKAAGRTQDMADVERLGQL